MSIEFVDLDSMNWREKYAASDGFPLVAQIILEKSAIEAHAMNAAGDLVLRFSREFVTARTPVERGMVQHMKAAARAIWHAK